MSTQAPSAAVTESLSAAPLVAWSPLWQTACWSRTAGTSAASTPAPAAGSVHDG
jgi:hypothetical protein